MANTGISYKFQLGHTPVLSRMCFLVFGSPWQRLTSADTVYVSQSGT